MIPNLSERFLAPAGWRTHSYLNEETGHKIHYGSVFPQREQPPSAVIVCLGGLSEFSEKYYELAHDMLDRGFAFWFIDWNYQGRSSRLPGHPQRRHSDGFDADLSDLHKLVSDYIKPSSVHPDRGRIPMIMLGHSMGGNIGLRFLAKHPKFFDAGAFTAPLLGIYNFTWPLKIVSILIRPLLPLVGKSYVFSGKDWHEDARKSDGSDKFSSDLVRDSIHNAWSKADASLQVGNPTFRWVIEALKSCAQLKRPETAKSIAVPVLIAMAGKDEIVDNDAIRAFAANLPQADLLDIEGAHHEIFMERNEYRNMFLNAFDKMIKEHKIASEENLKPF